MAHGISLLMRHIVKPEPTFIHKNEGMSRANRRFFSEVTRDHRRRPTRHVRAPFDTPYINYAKRLKKDSPETFNALSAF